jgi:hypothetical protein
MLLFLWGLKLKQLLLSSTSYPRLPNEIIVFINGSTTNYGKVKLVLKKSLFSGVPISRGSEDFA